MDIIIRLDQTRCSKISMYLLQARLSNQTGFFIKKIWYVLQFKNQGDSMKIH